jgi:hypothetical protein
MRRIALLAVLTMAMLAAPALATLASGVSATIHARGTIDERVRVRERSGTDFVHQQVTIAPGGHTGWHTHPGATLVTVKSGTLTFIGVRDDDGDDDDDDDDDGGRAARCFTVVYPTGKSFIDRGHGHVHIAHNLGSTPVELWVTYTGVPPGGGVRIDAADPGC